MKKTITLLVAIFAFIFAQNAKSQCNAYWTYAVDSNGTSVQFYDQSTPDSGQTIVSWFWDFGNGTSSTDQNPWVPQMQENNVCLTIVTSDSCSSTYCDTIVLSTNPCANFYAYGDVTPETVTGNDGAIDLIVGGGTAPYTYSWSNGATTEDLTGLSTGTYNVTVNDNGGCQTTNSFYVYYDSSSYYISGYVTNETAVGNDGAIDVTVYGGVAPYTYNWSNGATTEDLTGLSAGTYSITVTDVNSNIATETFYVYLDTANQQQYIDTLYAQIDSCLGNGVIDTAYVSSVTTIDSTHVDVTWTFVSGGVTNTITITYQFSLTGWYWTMVGVNCGTKSLQVFQQGIYVDGALGIQNNNINDLVLYPNPVKDNLKIEFNSVENTSVNIMITNMMGQNIYTENKQISTGNNSISINTNSLKSGIYFVNITNNKGMLITKKFVK